MSSFVDAITTTLKNFFSQTHVADDDLVQLKNNLDGLVVKSSDSVTKNVAQVIVEELDVIFNQVTKEQDEDKVEAYLVAVNSLVSLSRAVSNEVVSIQALSIARSILDIQGTRFTTLKLSKDFIVQTATHSDQLSLPIEQSLILKLVLHYVQAANSLDNAKAASEVASRNRAHQQLQQIIIAIGQISAKLLFNALEAPFFNSATRFHSLQLLNAWLTLQNQNLSEVAGSTIVIKLLKCLMNDRSAAVISLALQCLLMILPFTSIAQHLPRLFLIYTRCLIWEKFNSYSATAQGDFGRSESRRPSEDELEDNRFSIDPEWDILEQTSFAEETGKPELSSYFTYLYGLYPLNFTSYIRKPRRYLKQIDFPGADYYDLDQGLIRSRTEPYQRQHLLHPNFFTLTVEEEVGEDRWARMTAQEINASCLSLCCDSTTPLTFLQQPGLPDSPTLSPSIAPKVQPDPFTLSLLDTGSISADPDIAYLQRELLMTKSELSYEIFLKQKHASTISQLRHDRRKAVTVEAEIAALVNSNRTLEKKLNDSIKFTEKLQLETQTRKTHSQQSEEQLNNKIRVLRGKVSNQEALELSLKKAKDEVEALRDLVVEGEAREITLKDDLNKETVKNAETESLRTNLVQLRQELKQYKSSSVQSTKSSLGNASLGKEAEFTRNIDKSGVKPDINSSGDQASSSSAHSSIILPLQQFPSHQPPPLLVTTQPSPLNTPTTIPGSSTSTPSRTAQHNPSNNFENPAVMQTPFTPVGLSEQLTAAMRNRDASLSPSSPTPISNPAFPLFSKPTSTTQPLTERSMSTWSDSDTGSIKSGSDKNPTTNNNNKPSVSTKKSGGGFASVFRNIL